MQRQAAGRRRRRRAAAVGGRRRCARSAGGRRRARCRSRRRRRRRPRASRACAARLASVEIHLESPVLVATLPSRLHRRLEQHPRARRSARACGTTGSAAARGPRARRRRRRSGRPRRAGCPGRGRRLLGRVVASRRPPARSRPPGSPRCRAGLVADVTARLQRDVERGAAQVGFAAGGDRVDLGVRAAEDLVPALADDALVAHDHGADGRVRARRARRRAPRSRWRAPGGRDRSRCAARLTRSLVAAGSGPARARG